MLAEDFLRITGQQGKTGSIFNTKTEDSDQHRITLN
jgi:hypothetical protein